MLSRELLRDAAERVRDLVAGRGYDARAGGPLDRTSTPAAAPPWSSSRSSSSGATRPASRSARSSGRGETPPPRSPRWATSRAASARSRSAWRGSTASWPRSSWSCPTCRTTACRCGADETANARSGAGASRRRSTSSPRTTGTSGRALGILDFERGAKLSGARFTVSCAARRRGCERALVQFMLDLHTGEHGYSEVLPPFIVNARRARSAPASCPSSRTTCSGLAAATTTYYLIPTAEVPLTNLHRGEILDEAELPLALHRPHALLPRRGRLLRQGRARHDPPAPVRQGRAGAARRARSSSYDGARGADRPCRGGAAAARAALPRGDAVHRRHGLRAPPRPTTSRSGCRRRTPTARSPRAPTARPSRRAAPASATARRTAARPRRVHTLNGSGLAVGRTLVAVLENYQQADGSVRDPRGPAPLHGRRRADRLSRRRARRRLLRVAHPATPTLAVPRAAREFLG